MKGSSLCFVDVLLWTLVIYLMTHVPSIEMRTNDDEMQKYVAAEQPQISTPSPEPLTTLEEKKKGNNSCFHMPRSRCPANGTACVRIDPVSVFCCDVDSFRFKEALQIFRQNTSNLHVLNATLDKLNVSEAMYRRLVSMSFTDGNINMIVGQFPKHSSIACLNISNNNLTSKKLDPSNERPFAHLIYLTYLDASANNLTEFPLSLQSNRKITVDFSGNDYLPCKHFQMAIESKMVDFHNYEKTQCALDVRYNWFSDTTIVNIEYLHQQKELHKMCKFIKPEGINCTCSLERLELLTEEAVNLISVDCSNRQLEEMPTNLPTNTVKLNVSHNNITSLQEMSDDPSYDQLKQLIVDYNEITSIVDLEGTKFIDNFMLFSITHNKLTTIHTYVLSNKFDMTNSYTTFSIAGNYIHCDCNTEKVLKPWLIENSKNIPDFRYLQCENLRDTSVVNLYESLVCHANRDWTDYISYIIALEVLVLVLLISKVSYDYWIFKTAGYLPWPANKMPRLPCDWLCE